MPDTALTEALTEHGKRQHLDPKKLKVLGFVPLQQAEQLPAELSLTAALQISAPKSAAGKDNEQQEVLVLKKSLNLKPFALAAIFCSELELYVIDESIGELYTQYLHSSGSFNAALRAELISFVEDVYRQAGQSVVFKSPQLLRLLEHAKEHYQAEPEFLWADSPETAVLRRQSSNKWFAVLMHPKPKVLGLTGEALVPLVNLHLPAAMVTALKAEGTPFYPAYHMNKTHWISVRFDFLEDERLFSLAAQSFALATR